MLRRLYDWTMSLADHPKALWALAAVSFIEASVFPIPPDVLMIPMILAAPRRAWLIALVATVSSVLGGLLGYGIGHFFFEGIGRPILEALGKGDHIAAFNARFNGVGFWAVLIAGITPFPFKVITITSGVTGMNVVSFILSAIVARGIRFYAVTAIIYWFGPKTLAIVEKRLGLFTVLFCVLLVGGFVLMRYIL